MIRRRQRYLRTDGGTGPEIGPAFPGDRLTTGRVSARASPYAVALVDLDEQPGLRLPGRMVAADDVQIGMRVQARIEDLRGGDFRVVVFAPAVT